MTKESLLDQGAAYLTAGLMAGSDKIQTSRLAIELWERLRSDLKINSRLDYLVLHLTKGRVMDLKIEKGNYFSLVQETFEKLRNEVVITLTYPILGVKKGSQILANSYIVRLNDIAAAMIAAAYTDVSRKIESSKEILNIWSSIREMNIVRDNNEFLTALLVIARIKDLRKEIEVAGGLNVIIENFNNLLLSVEPHLKVTKNDLAAAHLTIALVTQTPEIESNGQVLNIWKEFKEKFQMDNEDLDITSAILAGGLIMNRKTKLEYDDIKDIFISIKNKLKVIHNSKSG